MKPASKKPAPMLNDASSSSSDDPFLTNGGVKHHVSMYSRLAYARREFDDQHNLCSPEKEIEIQDSDNSTPNRDSHGVRSVEKDKVNGVVAISSDSDSDDEPMPSLRESMRARKRRGRPKQSEGVGNSARRAQKDNKKNSGSEKDVFAISDDDLRCTDHYNTDRGIKRRRKRNVLADIDADDEFELLVSTSTAADLHTRRVLQAAHEAARTTDVAVLEAEAEKAAREAAAAAAAVEQEKLKAAECAQLNNMKKDTHGGNGATVDKAKAIPVVLKVRCGPNVHKLRIRKTDRLLKMLEPFCKKFGLDVSRAEMQVDGESVGKDDTPITYDLEDMMMVDVVIRNS